MTGREPFGTLADLHVRDIAFILFRHLRLIVVTVLLVCTAGVLIAVYWPPSYGAYASVLLKGRMLDRDPGSLEGGETRALPINESDLYSELRIIESPGLISEALEALRYNGEDALVDGLGETPAAQVNAVREGLSAAVVPSSNVIEVRIVHADPQIALRVLEALFDSYTQYRQRIYRPEAVASFLSAQVARLEDELAARQAEITAYIDRTGLVDADGQIQTDLALRREIQSSRLRLEEEMALNEATRDDLEALLAAPDVRVFVPIPVDSSVVLHNRAEVMAWLRRFDSRQAAMNGALEKLEAEVAAIDARNRTVRREHLTLTTLQRKAAVLETALQVLWTRKTEAMVDSQPRGQQLNPYVSILAPPRLFDGPLFPKPKLVLAVALAAGILLAFVLAALREVLDPAFSRPVDVETTLGVPVLFSLPDTASLRAMGPWPRPRQRPNERSSRPPKKPGLWTMRPRAVRPVPGILGKALFAALILGGTLALSHSVREQHQEEAGMPSVLPWLDSQKQRAMAARSGASLARISPPVRDP